MDRTHRTRIFEKVYDEHARGLLRYAIFKVTETALAEDIVAETFLKYWQKYSSGEVIRNERAFLYRITYGLIVDHYRKEERQRTTTLENVHEEELGEKNSIAEDIDIRNAALDARTAMKKLKQEYADILLLHYVEDLSFAEIADILTETENNLRVRAHRALRALRTIMNI